MLATFLLIQKKTVLTMPPRKTKKKREKGVGGKFKGNEILERKKDTLVFLFFFLVSYLDIKPALPIFKTDKLITPRRLKEMLLLVEEARGDVLHFDLLKGGRDEELPE